MHGEEKDTFTIWFTLGQRTLHYETYVMPAPEENHEQFYEHLLRRNLKLYGAAFAIGEEDAVFLVGQLAERGRRRRRARPRPRLALRVGRAVLPSRAAHRVRVTLHGLTASRTICMVHFMCILHSTVRREPGAALGRPSGKGRHRPSLRAPATVYRHAAERIERSQLVGGGRMGEALLAGLLASGWAEPERARRRREAGRPPRAAGASQFPGVVVARRARRSRGRRRSR